MSVRWGIVGCGDVVRKRVAKAIQDEPRSELVAVCRRNIVELARFAADFAVPQTYRSADELIAANDIDAVYIATPVSSHLPQTLAAAAMGKHVLVEKPMAMSTVECQSMIDACKDADVKLGVAYYRRFYPVVDRMLEIIDSGEIGMPMCVSAVTSTSVTIGTEGAWRVNEALSGGGALMDIGSHRINIMLAMFGPAKAVHGVRRTIGTDYSSDNSVSFTLEFESGCLGAVQCFFRNGGDPDEFCVTGSNGRLICSPLNNGQLKIESADSREESHPPSTNFNAPQIADFVDAIQNDSLPRVTGEEGLETNRVMEQIG